MFQFDNVEVIELNARMQWRNERMDTDCVLEIHR